MGGSAVAAGRGGIVMLARLLLAWLLVDVAAVTAAAGSALRHRGAALTGHTVAGRADTHLGPSL